ncbi:unnamed protein product, partial [Medioppia subpectinata]
DKAIDESAIFVTSPYVISYKNTFYDYKPDVETYITAQINDIFGESVAELPVKVILKDESGNFILNKTQTSKPSMQLVSDHLGRISFPITVGKNVKELHVSIRTEDPKLDREDQIEVAHVLWADVSASGFVYISSKSKYSSSLAVGDTYRSPLVTRGSVVSDKIYLIVVNRGHIIHSERISADKGIKFEITREMTPFIRVMILAVTRDSQLVSDSIKIEVNEDNCGLDMSVENDTKQVNPGKTLNLILNGTKGDSVALLAVDEAVYILRDSDRLTKNKLTKELVKSDMGCGPGTGLDVFLVANNVGLKIIRGTWPTNNHRDCNYKATILKTYLPNDANCHQAFLHCCRMTVKPRIQAVSTSGVFAEFPGKYDRTRSGSEIDEYVHIAYEQDLEDKTFVRKDFRESWLFDVVLLNQSSNVLPVTFPHSITTWALSAMSLSPTNGFCILPSPLRLRTFQDIFIQISLPYSVVQSEQMEIVVTVFNYGINRYPVLVYTYGVEGICSEAEMVGEKTKKHITVDKNSFATVTFPMVPLRKGIFDVKIVALWSNGGDVVVKKLNVVAPGITVEEDLTFQLDPKNRQRRTKRSLKTGKIEDDISPDDGLQKTVVNVEPDLTRNIVPGTRECIIAGIGNEYGATSYTTLSDIDRLIRQPKGCGEQNMLYMAPTLYTLNYLKSIDHLNGDLKYRGLKYIRNGYKRQLSFRKDDGSFGAFVSRPASIWLTAFVMKVFCQSSPFLKEDKFDHKVIESGLNWLITRQKSDGSWIETHAVVHEDALGGVKGIVPLTAFTLISFHECRRVLKRDYKENKSLVDSMNKTIYKSENYLKLNQNEIIRQKNTYAMALVAYSLTFTNPQNSLKLVDALHSTANIDNNRNYKYWRHDYEVEATSYALMAMLNSGNRNSVDGLSISNYLNSVRSYTGSFSSTQDTIVALEALSQYIERQRSPTNAISLVCNITSHESANRFKRALAFNADNALVLQTFKLDSDSSKLKFMTSGEGMGQMFVKLKYNVFEPPEVLCRFDLNIDVKEWKAPERIGRDMPEDIDDNFFDDFGNDLVQRLDLKHTRTKRSFWRNPFRPKPSSQMDSVSDTSSSNSRHRTITEPVDQNSEKIELNSDIMDDKSFKKNNLSSNSIGSNDGKSKLVLLIETCIRHIPRYYSDMSLIEVGILSGYKPNKDDLEEIIKMEDSLVSKYEISERNVVFYFEKVPFGRPYCLQFRKIQEHNVGNVQAAMVKVYDYYHKDHGCSQLYTPSRISEYIETKCNSQVCECAKRENCPTAKSLVEIGKIAEKRVVRARELFQELVCSDKFNYVFTGTFEGQNVTQNRFKFLKLRVHSVLKGKLQRNDKFGLSLNPDCYNMTTSGGKEAIIFGHFNDKVGHLNSTSIVYDISSGLKGDETQSYIVAIIDHLEGMIRRINWKCSEGAQT